MVVRVAFAGSRWLGLRCLEELVARRDIEVAGAFLKGRGWEPTDCFAPCRRMGVPILSEAMLADLLTSGGVDLCVAVCTSHIFTADEIGQCGLGIVNLHPAPLPFYRGCNSYAHAIINGDRQYGVSLHYVDEGIDTGPIIARDWLAIEPADTGRSLYDRAQAVAANMFHRELDRISYWAGWGGAVPDVLAQDGTMARYYRRDSLDALRDLAGVAEPDRSRRRRALDFPPFPPAYDSTEPRAPA